MSNRIIITDDHITEIDVRDIGQVDVHLASSIILEFHVPALVNILSAWYENCVEHDVPEWSKEKQETFSQWEFGGKEYGISWENWQKGKRV